MEKNKATKIQRIKMKKISITPAIILFSCYAFSQTWFDAGLKGGYGVNLLYNQNYLNDRNFTPNLSYGYMYGGKLAFNFNEEHSVTFDVTTSYFNQGFSCSILNADSTRSNFSRNIGFNSLNFLLMYRKMKASSYVEIGPQYSTVMKARGSSSTGSLQVGSFSGDSDISPYLAKSYYSMVLGFGGFVMGTENFGITLGIRLAYTLNDIISAQGQQVNFPSVTNYPSYKPSNPVTAMMVMELNYDLGYLASAKCGKKTKFLMF